MAIEESELMLLRHLSPARRASDRARAHAKVVADLEQVVMRIPASDHKKVARIKAAIAAGSYKIDSHRIAECMNTFETQLAE